jgi:N-acetylglucosaminyl-diphospho-decaprenol L-rhamnosyltransferase
MRQSEPPTLPVRVCVVTVSYRTLALVRESISALEGERNRALARGWDLHFYIVDNDSGDGEPLAAYVRQRGFEDWVTVLVSPTNGGFAYGNNFAIRQVYADGRSPEYFFFLNPDAAVLPGATQALVDFLDANPRAGTAGSSLEYADGTRFPYAFRFPNLVDEIVRPLPFGSKILARFLPRFQVAHVMGDGPASVDWFPGAAMMCRAQAIAELGGMDESYFLYFEETDFFLKLQRAGWGNWYVPQSRVVHHAGQSTGITGPEGQEKPKPPYWYASRRRFFQKNMGLPLAVAADCLSLLARGVGGAPKVLRGQSSAGIFADLARFYRGSSIPPANWRRAPTREFRPGS